MILYEFRADRVLPVDRIGNTREGYSLRKIVDFKRSISPPLGLAQRGEKGRQGEAGPSFVLLSRWVQPVFRQQRLIARGLARFGCDVDIKRADLLRFFAVDRVELVDCCGDSAAVASRGKRRHAPVGYRKDDESSGIARGELECLLK